MLEAPFPRAESTQHPDIASPPAPRAPPGRGGAGRGRGGAGAGPPRRVAMLQPQQQAAGSAAMAVAVGRAAVGAGAGSCGGSGLRCEGVRGDALRSPSAPGLPGGGLVAAVRSFIRSFY